jgi:hypothetical protein
MMQRVIDHASPDIKADLETANPYRAWRILLLNTGITAVRAQDVPGLQQAFDQIQSRLPDNAPDFFQEARNQVEQGEFRPEVVETVRAYTGEGGH